MSAFTIVIEHPDAEKILRAAIDSYGALQDAHAQYITDSKPREGESIHGRRRRANVHIARAAACRQATITPGGQAGPSIP